MKRLTIAALALCLAVPAVAQDRVPPLPAEVKNIYFLRGTAFAAAFECNIRTRSWWMPLEQGLMLYATETLVKLAPNVMRLGSIGTGSSESDIARFGERSAAKDAFLQQGRSDYENGRRFYGTHCSELVNSALMDDLDKAQWRLTGGYH